MDLMRYCLPDADELNMELDFVDIEDIMGEIMTGEIMTEEHDENGNN